MKFRTILILTVAAMVLLLAFGAYKVRHSTQGLCAPGDATCGAPPQSSPP